MPNGENSKMSRRDKIILASGLGAVGLGATIAVVASVAQAKPKKKKGPGFGLRADKTCTRFDVDEVALRDSIRAQVRKMTVKGSVDPFAVAQAIVKRGAPNCPNYPAKMQTPTQAKLFYDVFEITLGVMSDDGLIDLSGATTFQNMIRAWAIGNGMNPSELQ